jgi:hypothetical protein
MMQRPASSHPLLFNQTLIGQGSLVQSANTLADVFLSCACVLLLVAAIVFYSKTGRKWLGHTIPLITSLLSDKTNDSSEHLSVNLLDLLQHGYEKVRNQALYRPCDI